MIINYVISDAIEDELASLEDMQCYRAWLVISIISMDLAISTSDLSKAQSRLTQWSKFKVIYCIP